MPSVASLVAQIRAQILEPAARPWSDTEIVRWINEAVRDIARRAEVLQATSTIAAVLNQQEYTLPATVLRVYRVEWRPSASQAVTTLEYRDFNSMDSVWWTNQRQTTGEPYWFTLWGYPPSLKMIVYPTPANAGDFKCFYYTSPTDATLASQSIELPAGWEDAVVWYGDYQARRALRDDRWMEAKNQYEQRVDTLIEHTRRWSDQAGAITTEGGLLPAWLYQDW